MPTTKKTTRRRPAKRALAQHAPAPGPEIREALDRHSVQALKGIAKAAGVGIPKTKEELVHRLASSHDVSVSTTSEVVAFRPRR